MGEGSVCEGNGGKLNWKIKEGGVIFNVGR